MLALVVALFWTILSTVTLAEAVVVDHDENDVFEPVYMRQYNLSEGEARYADACQNPSRDCDWAMIVIIRQESCVPPDASLQASDPVGAYKCPLLLAKQNYHRQQERIVLSHHRAVKSHVTNLPEVDLPFFLMPRTTLVALEEEYGSAYTYADLESFQVYTTSVYRGLATEFSELVFVPFHSTRSTVQEKVEHDYTMTARGVLDESGHRFHVRIESMHDLFQPLIWNVHTGIENDAIQAKEDHDQEKVLVVHTRYWWENWTKLFG